MRDVFLSYRYDDANKALASRVEELLESHNLRAVTGDVLGGRQLTPELKRQIEEADALIALLTRRDEIVGGGWTTHPYCLNELQHAQDEEKPTIAVVESGVTPAGFDAEREHIPFDSANPLAAFLRLSRTIWRWKKSTGRTLKIQIIPEDVATEIWQHRDDCVSEYRLTTGLHDTEWKRALAKKEPAGLYLYVQVPDNTMMVEVRVKGAGKSWYSDSTPINMPLELTEH